MALLISVPEAAKLLGIPRNKGYEWCRRKILPCVRDGGRIYVPTRAVERLAERIEMGDWPQGTQLIETKKAR